MAEAAKIFSIGHSTLSYEAFVSLLRAAGITAVADVRTSPFSRHYPHFSRNMLQPELKADGVAYVFLGEELGGRPKDERFYTDGVANYERMAQASSFTVGLDRLWKGSADYRIAMMCSEHDPTECHRCLLVGRALKERGAGVHHILPSGRQLTQTEVEEQLLSAAKNEHLDMFASKAERLAAAYRFRSDRVAYSKNHYVPKAAAE